MPGLPVHHQLPKLAQTHVRRVSKATLSSIWKWQPTPVLLHGESHGQRSLVGCNPLGRKELDMTEVT